MAVKIRLARAGAKKAPFYRVVAADSRAPRDGRFIEILGRYNPRTKPSTVELDLEKVDAWLAKGAQPTETAAKLIAVARGEKQYAPKAEQPSAKSAAKAAAEAAQAQTAEAAAGEESASEDAAASEEQAAEAGSDAPEAE